MILYTPIERAEIFPEAREDPKRHFISYEGRQIYVEQLDNGSYELVQLLSTDPQDFLKDNYYPGRIISTNDK